MSRPRPACQRRARVRSGERRGAAAVRRRAPGLRVALPPRGHRRRRGRDRAGSRRCSSTRSRRSTARTGSRSRRGSAPTPRPTSRGCCARAACFEYWAHEACLLPIEDYPLFKRRMLELQGPPLVGPAAHRRGPRGRAPSCWRASARRARCRCARSRGGASRCGAGSRRSARSSICSRPASSRSPGGRASSASTTCPSA